MAHREFLRAARVAKARQGPEVFGEAIPSVVLPQILEVIKGCRKRNLNKRNQLDATRYK